MPNRIFLKFHNPSHNVTANETILLCKEREFFKHYISRNSNILAQNYPNYVTPLHTLDTKVYPWKKTPAHSTNLTASHAKVKKLAKKVKGCEHKLYMDYMDNFLLQP
jgi:hypothetical protein